MELQQLRVVVKVAELGSITRTAQLLDTTQSAVSRQVNALELELGGRLFRRTGRGVLLTPLGERVEPRIRAALLELERVRGDAKAMAGVPSGDVYVGMLPSIAPQVCTQLLATIRNECPEVRLHVSEGFSGELDERLADGRLDMALLFRFAPDERRAEADDQALAPLHTYLIGPKGDPLTDRSAIPFNALDRLPLILPSFPNGVRASLDQLARTQGVGISVAMEADSIPVQLALVADSPSPAYAVASYYAVAQAVRDGRLQATRIVSPGIERTLTLARSTRRPDSLGTRSVETFVKRIAHELIAIEP